MGSDWIKGRLHNQKRAKNYINIGKNIWFVTKLVSTHRQFRQFKLLYLENYLTTKLISNYLILNRKVRSCPNNFGRGCQINCQKIFHTFWSPEVKQSKTLIKPLKPHYFPQSYSQAQNRQYKVNSLSSTLQNGVLLAQFDDAATYLIQLDQIFFCNLVVLESTCYRTRGK